MNHMNDQKSQTKVEELSNKIDGIVSDIKDKISGLRSELEGLETHLGRMEEFKNDLHDLSTILEQPEPQAIETAATQPPETIDVQKETKLQSVSEEKESDPTLVPEGVNDENKDTPVQEIDDGSLNSQYQSAKPNLSEKLSSGGSSDLKVAIGVNERFTFVNDLFNKDVGAFDKAIRVLNEKTSFEDAEGYIRSELASNYSWKEEDPNVNIFMEIVKKRFN